MKKILLLVLLCLLSSAPCRAAFSGGDKGTAAAQFLKLGAGARAAALGDAYSSLADDASAVYWNPAALRQVKKRSATFMHAAYIESTFFDYAGYVQPLGKHSSAGLGIQYLSAGSLTETDNTGTELGTFHPSDLAVSLAYARDLGGYSLGVAARFVQTRIIASAATGAADIGVLSPKYLRGKLRLAFTVSNLGGKLKLEEKAEELPLAARLGSSFKFSDHWRAGLDLGLPKDNAPYLAAGAEYVLPAGFCDLAGRAGYNTRTSSDISGFSGFSFGLGFGFRKWSLDYALVPFGGLGLTHRIGVDLKF